MILPEHIVKALEHYANEENWRATLEEDGCEGIWAAKWAYEDGSNPWDIAAKALKKVEE